MSKLHIIADRWNLTHRGLFVVGSQPNVPPSIREFYYTAASSYTRSVYNNSTSCAATGMYSSDIKHAAQVISEFGHSVSVEVNNSVVLYIDGVPYVNPNTKITSTGLAPQCSSHNPFLLSRRRKDLAGGEGACRPTGG